MTTEARPTVLPFPPGQFGTVMLDPPWHFDNVSTRAAAERHYPTLSTAQIATLPVDQLALPDAHIYLWATAAHLRQALWLMEEVWKFTFIQPITWIKTKDLWAEHYLEGGCASPKIQIGLGNYFRHATEICLFGVRGKAPARTHSIPNVIFAPRGRHSKKPDRIYEYANELSHGPYLELFARYSRPGWSVWGLEAPGVPPEEEKMTADPAELAEG